MKTAKISEERIRELGLIEEVRISFRFVKAGLREIDRIQPGNDFYHPPILFLSTGIERILKCMICMNFRELNDRWPGKQDRLWSTGAKGHDLIELRKKVLEFCIELTGEKHRDDIRVLSVDARIDKLLKVLSDYGRGGRYFNLDQLMDRCDDENEDPARSYDQLSADLALATHGNDILRLIGTSEAHRAYTMMNAEIKSLVERFVRALARQFIYGSFYKGSKRFIGDLTPFYLMDDHHLGKNWY
jgi:hypothetical protein